MNRRLGEKNKNQTIPSSGSITNALSAQDLRVMQLKQLKLQNLANVSQTAQLKHTPSSSLVIQRAVGNQQGEDNDRGNIQVANLVGNENVTVSRAGQNDARARVQHIVIGGVARYNRVLKHYAVIKNGLLYQFPIKYPREPSAVQGGLGVNHQNGQHIGERAGQVEPYGGNAELPQNHVNGQENLTARRDATLTTEYHEENEAHNNAQLNFVRGKKFGSQFGVGTLSIMNTDQQLQAGDNMHQNQVVQDRSFAEMAGSITIDCTGLMQGILVNDPLEHAIGALVEQARTQFFVAHVQEADPRNERSLRTVFERQAGILAHLVTLVKEDVEAERAAHAQAQIQVQQALMVQAMAQLQQQHAQNQQQAQQQQLVPPVQVQHQAQNNLVRLGLPIALVILIIAVIIKAIWK